jgi:hypothetical protein
VLQREYVRRRAAKKLKEKKEKKQEEKNLHVVQHYLRTKKARIFVFLSVAVGAL